MNRLRDLPIQRKMLVMTLLICGAVLCVAIAALFTFQVLNFRSNFQQDASTVAVIMARNCTAALAFKDEKSATELVASLAAKPSVLGASLVLPDGTMFAHLGKAEDSKSLSEFPPAGKHKFSNGHLLLTQPVELLKERIGTLYLRSNYQETFLKLLGFYGLVILGVIVVSIGLAAFLSGRLRFAHALE